MTKALEPGNLRRGIKFKKSDIKPKPSYRPVQQVSLGCHAKGAALPHPDHTDPESVLLGQNRRVCFDPPRIKRKWLKRFKRFVKRWCKRHLIPLPEDSDITLEFWLALTNYPEWRKQELREAWSLIDGIVQKRHFLVNSFIKDETYPEFKNLRGINARTDVFKCAVGPYFKLIERELFKNPWFIKKVPVPDRAKFIFDLVHGENLDYFGTDHTSFEGHMQEEFMEACEFYLYDYMAQNLFGFDEFTEYVHNVLGGDNIVVSKYFSYIIRATRMTGEMCTSLGNGFTNLMLLLFVAEESKIVVVGVVEGDDSIFNSPKGKRLRTEIFEKLGFRIKIEKFSSVGVASFCGNVFAPGDFLNVTDPVEALLSFGWTTSLYAKSKTNKLKELLRSKSLSLLYEYKGCPILKNLALYGIRMTEGFRARTGQTNEYQRELIAMQLEDMKKNGLPIVEIPMTTRQLVEDLYKVPISTQLLYESYLDNLVELQPLDLELLYSCLNQHQKHYYIFYSREVDYKGDLNHPNIPDVSTIIWNDEYIARVNKARTALLK